MQTDISLGLQGSLRDGRRGKCRPELISLLPKQLFQSAEIARSEGHARRK